MYTTITRVTVSEHQSATLRASLACTANRVDHTVVVTSAHDRDTRDLCAHASNVTCRVTDALHRNGNAFNKGAAIEEMQRVLHGRGEHLLIMDADICLSRTMWKRIHAALPLPHGVLLSIVDRCIYTSPGDAQTRQVSKRDRPTGFTTMGFFQLYRASPTSPYYPTNYPTAAGSDLAFGKSFHHRIVVTGWAHHMGDTGNWYGRRQPIAATNWTEISFAHDCK